MRVAYATIYDAADAGAWSGSGYHIARCLELAGFEVERIGPLQRRAGPLSRFWQCEAKLRRRAYQLDRDPGVVRRYAAQLEHRLATTTSDLVFSPGTIPIAQLETPRPLAFWSDATFAAMTRSYPEYQVLSDRGIQAGWELDDGALARANVALYASEWAARSAVEDHGADPAKVEVVPFGANMPITHDRDELASIVARRPSTGCRLLFVGVDWARKGGDRAVQAARILNDRGLPTELDVVGPIPRDMSVVPPWVRVHGFVDKTTDAGVALLRRLFEQAHVLIHPARAEAFGVVFCEAAAHGVLSVASRVGGIPSAVREGVTGVLCDPDTPADGYADEVWRLLEDRSRYEAMALGAFDEYTRTLSWDASAVRVRERLVRLV